MVKYYKRLKLLLLLCFLTPVALAQFSVSGQITDDVNGEPLIGVNVVIKGTSTGVTTGIDGNYSITIPGQSGTLIFSSVGYLAQEVPVDASSGTIDMALAEDVFNLQEVVVTGLASSVKRSNLANAVSTVSAKELTGATSVQTLDAALQSKVTGANIYSNSGAPGGGISIKLRGNTTITGSSEPLYIVDGVYMDNSAFSAGTNPVSQTRTNGEITDEQDNPSNRIADLNPEDIENIEILKGASASSIYGARANAGVIIITTKRGKSGKTSINFQQDIGVAKILNPLGVRNFTNAIVSANFSAADVAAFQSGPLFDYEDEVYGETGLLLNTNLSVSGGTEKTKFFISGSNKDEDGIIKTTGYKKQSVRANIDHRVSEVFDFGVTTNYIHSEASRSITNNDNAGVSLGIALTSTVPWDNLFPDANGVYPNNPKAASNPLQTRDLGQVLEENNRVLVGSTVNINVIRRSNSFLKFVLRGGIDDYTNKTTAYFPEILQFQVGQNNGFYSRGNNTVFNLNTSVAAVFNTKAGSVDLTSQLGTARLRFEQERLTTQATQLIGGQSNLEQAGAISVFNKKITTEDIGYFLQQEANWEDKVIATAGIRLDKSSLNGDPDKLYGYPKVSVAANLHNLGVNVNNLNQLKVRVAYGEAGGVPTFNSNDLALSSQTVLGGSNIEGAGSLIALQNGNADIKPERSKEFEAGFDLGFLDSRITLEATWYIKKVEDLIISRQVPQSSGFTTEVINGGALENKGIELAINATIVNSPSVRWNFRPAWWRNRSVMTQLDVPTFQVGSFASALGIFQIEEGQPVTQIVGPTVDDSGNQLAGGADQVLGNAEPDFQMSLYNDVTFLKNFSFTMLWHWKEGGDNIQLSSLLTDFGQTSFDYDDDTDGNGVINGDQRIAGLLGDANGNVDASQFVIESSYWKLREIALYYTLPKAFIESAFGGAVERIRFGVSGNNLILISDYNSYDPEVSNFGSDGISTGVEVTPFPSAKRMFFHLSARF